MPDVPPNELPTKSPNLDSKPSASEMPSKQKYTSVADDCESPFQVASNALSTTVASLPPDAEMLKLSNPMSSTVASFAEGSQASKPNTTPTGHSTIDESPSLVPKPSESSIPIDQSSTIDPAMPSTPPDRHEDLAGAARHVGSIARDPVSRVGAFAITGPDPSNTEGRWELFDESGPFAHSTDEGENSTVVPQITTALVVEDDDDRSVLLDTIRRLEDRARDLEANTSTAVVASEVSPLPTTGTKLRWGFWWEGCW